jgi:hypothetical protein
MGDRAVCRLLITGASAVARGSYGTGHRPEMAWPHARSQAADAGAGSSGQQDGANSVGAVGPRKNLSTSGRGCIRRDRDAVGRWKVRRRYGATVKRRGRENQIIEQFPAARARVVDRSANPIRARGM